MPCKVYLVGAGPGDPELLTLKGLECIRKADTIVYDYLANETLLAFARPETKLVYVGKKGFSKHITQDQINCILLDEVRALDAESTGQRSEEQRCIVRLKGGDPYVFGRGGEEAQVLAEHRVDFEVVPGVTSGIAAPACAGIPVTHRGVSTSVAFITGNEDPTKAESDIDWNGIANGAQTLCFYMGIRNLPSISAKLIEAGKDPHTPVALIRWGTTSRQEELYADLESVARKAEEANFCAPAIIVVGDVVRLRESIRPEALLPLKGRTIAVTRSRTQSSTMLAKLKGLGANAIECPTIEIQPLADYSLADAALDSLSRGVYDWVVLTSVNGVDCFFKRIRAKGLDSRVFAGAKIAAIGPATARELERYGIKADFVPAEYKGEAVAEGLISQGAKPGMRVLIARAKEARQTIPRLLAEAEMEVDVVPLYETIPSKSKQTESALDAVIDSKIDAITFTSSSTATNFCKLLLQRLAERGMDEGEFERLTERLDAYSIGPITSQTMRENGLIPKAEARVYTIDGLIETILDDTTKLD